MSRPLRSFVDLREFAGETAGSFHSGRDGYLAARRFLPLPPGPVSLAAIDLDGHGDVDHLDADEFVIVLEGGFEVTGCDGDAFVLAVNQSGVLPKGGRFDWRTAGPTRLLVIRDESGDAGAGGPVMIDEAAILEPSNAPLAELLVGPTPSCRNHTDYKSANGEFLCGTWDSTPYHRRSMCYRHYELMYLLDGAVTLQDGAGRSATFAKGDIFLVEQGAECSWDSKEYVKKVYAIYRPA